MCRELFSVGGIWSLIGALIFYSQHAPAPVLGCDGAARRGGTSIDLPGVPPATTSNLSHMEQIYNTSFTISRLNKLNTIYSKNIVVKLFQTVDPLVLYIILPSQINSWFYDFEISVSLFSFNNSTLTLWYIIFWIRCMCSIFNVTTYLRIIKFKYYIQIL